MKSGTLLVLNYKRHMLGIGVGLLFVAYRDPSTLRSFLFPNFSMIFRGLAGYGD